MAAWFLKEVWIDLRPFLKAMVVDFILSCALWVFFYGFDQLTRVAPINGMAGEWALNFHAAGIILAFSLFGVLFILDVLRINREKDKLL